jgi:hypothetical protein
MASRQAATKRGSGRAPHVPARAHVREPHDPPRGRRWPLAHPGAGRWPLARLGAGGTGGNERLTAETGAILILLLAVLGVTILRIGQLLWIHLFVGLLLLGPVALKLASTGYRFVRYYTFEPRYRRKGPPAPALRLLAPVVVLSTLVVFASGVALLLLGPSSRGSLLLLHKASFFLWLGVTALHVIGHLPEIQRNLLGGAELRAAVFAGASSAPRSASPPDGAGRAGRALSLTGALAAGLALALAWIPQYGPWLHYHRPH